MVLQVPNFGAFLFLLLLLLQQEEALLKDLVIAALVM
jgi:hypothetical protein